MSDPPRDRTEFWIRFTCAFIFFGAILALLGISHLDGLGLTRAVVTWAVCVLGISLYAAYHGDRAWERLIHFFRWW